MALARKRERESSMAMLDDISQVRDEGLQQVTAAGELEALEQARVTVLGRSGSLTALSQGMRDVPKDQKAEVGKALNEARQAIESAIEAKKSELQEAADRAALAGIDVTLPGTAAPAGSIHPLTQLEDRAIRIFRRMGFALAEGPELETEFRCFDALNTPPDHPARNESDTFYFADGRLLRTHTSTVQISTMEQVKPPVRIISPGYAFRRDEVDATHSFQFTQMEALYVDAEVSVADLKGTLEFFFRELLGPQTQTRFRPHFFPFTEPSFEVDAKLSVAGREPRWVEMGGCGIVDPAVFERVNEARGDKAYDPEKVSGFAFGLGLDRLAMTLWQIPDIRYFTENDLRFLRQF